MKLLTLFITLSTAILGSSLAMESKTQEEINKIVASTSQEVYQKINKNWKYIPAGKGQKLTCESVYFKPDWVETFGIVSGEKVRENIATLILQTDPRELIPALNDLISKEAYLECTIALTTAKIFCLKTILGDEKFIQYAQDFYHEIKSNLPWSSQKIYILKELLGEAGFTRHKKDFGPKKIISIDSINEFFHELPLQFISTIQRSAIAGSITYITNIPEYHSMKPNGNAMGSNVICVGLNQYVGFSAIYKDGPKSIEVIEGKDLELFCLKDDLEKDGKNHEILCQKFERNKDDFIIKRRKEQEKIDFYQIFDKNELNDYIQTGFIDL